MNGLSLHVCCNKCRSQARADGRERGGAAWRDRLPRVFETRGTKAVSLSDDRTLYATPLTRRRSDSDTGACGVSQSLILVVLACSHSRSSAAWSSGVQRLRSLLSRLTAGGHRSPHTPRFCLSTHSESFGVIRWPECDCVCAGVGLSEGGAGCSPTCTGASACALGMPCGAPAHVSGCGDARGSPPPCPTTLSYLTLPLLSLKSLCGGGVRRAVLPSLPGLSWSTRALGVCFLSFFLKFFLSGRVSLVPRR